MNDTDTTAQPQATAQNPEVVDLTESEQLLAEALEELQTTSRDEAKAVIRTRVAEIQRLKTLLAKAEADLAQLVRRSPEEIAMLSSSPISWAEPTRNSAHRRIGGGL